MIYLIMYHNFACDFVSYILAFNGQKYVEYTSKLFITCISKHILPYMDVTW
jgi:hypothetical protein